MYSPHFRGSYWNALGIQMITYVCRNLLSDVLNHALIKRCVWSFWRQYLAIIPFSVLSLRALQPRLCQQADRLESHSTKPKTHLSLTKYRHWKKQGKRSFPEQVRLTQTATVCFPPMNVSWRARPFQPPIQPTFAQAMSWFLGCWLLLFRGYLSPT